MCQRAVDARESCEVDELCKTSTSKNKTPPEAGLFASLTHCTKSKAHEKQNQRMQQLRGKCITRFGDAHKKAPTAKIRAGAL